jgi:hypothetical protein
MCLIFAVFLVVVLWVSLLWQSHPLLSYRYGRKSANASIGVVALCSLIVAVSTFVGLDTHLEVSAYGNNPPVAAFGFAGLVILLYSLAAFIGSAVLVTLVAVVALEIHRWRRKANRQSGIGV